MVPSAWDHVKFLPRRVRLAGLKLRHKLFSNLENLTKPCNNFISSVQWIGTSICGALMGTS
jgi:hypothetical protein